MVRSCWETDPLHRDCWAPLLVLVLLLCCVPSPVVKVWPKMPNGRPPVEPAANAEPEPVCTCRSHLSFLSVHMVCKSAALQFGPAQTA
jgi:hypothetical protein